MTTVLAVQPRLEIEADNLVYRVLTDIICDSDVTVSIDLNFPEQAYSISGDMKRIFARALHFQVTWLKNFNQKEIYPVLYFLVFV